MSLKRPAGKRAGKSRRRSAPRAPRQASPKKRGPSRRKQKSPLSVERPQGRERVLALDTSSKCVGWAVFDDGRLLQHGRYVQQGKGHGQRLASFRTWTLALLQEFAPEQLVYEAPYAGRMRNTFGVLSKYAGVVESCHYEHFSREIPPANAVAAHLVKKAIGATKGRSHEENKKIVVLLVNQVFGLGLKYTQNDATKKTSQDDEADAIALNWAWHLLYRRDDAGADPAEVP